MLKINMLILGFMLALCCYADSSATEISVKVQNKSTGIFSSVEKSREYPKYKTEKGLLKAYARGWNSQDFDLMYHLLSGNAREDWSFSKFERLYKADAGTNGGAAGFESIKRLDGNDFKSVWMLKIVYKNSSARAKQVRVTLLNEGGFWFVSEGGILPPDLSMFDR